MGWIMSLLGKALGHQSEMNQATNQIKSPSIEGAPLSTHQPSFGGGSNAAGLLGIASSLLGNTPKDTSTQPPEVPGAEATGEGGTSGWVNSPGPVNGAENSSGWLKSLFGGK